MGIKDPDQSVYEKFGSTVRFNDGRYEVSLPWKNPPHSILADNNQLSLKRLQGLLCRLRQNPKVFQEYDFIIQNQLCQGIVEAIDDPESIGIVKVHYLTHHGVIWQDKETTKLRIVYDASQDLPEI